MIPVMRSETGDSPHLAFDCFAGCGGMSEGLRQAGYRIVGAIEVNKEAAQVYSLNHPEATVWMEDIRCVSGQNILETLGLKRGRLDLLGGCPPCQGFSRLRTRNGNQSINDERNDLIYEFERLVIELYPKCIMLENVPKLYTDERFARFTTVLDQFGYRYKADVLNVRDYGVPQRRRRTVLVASRIGEPRMADAVNHISTVRQAIGALPPAGRSGDPLHDMPEKRNPLVLKRIKSIPKDGGGRSSLPAGLALTCHRNSDGYKDVYGRMAWDAPSPTITTGCFNPSKGRFLHPQQDRAITIREAALLQSFPPDYCFPPSLGKVKLAELIGNALPPKFICIHAEMLRKKGGV